MRRASRFSLAVFMVVALPSAADRAFDTGDAQEPETSEAIVEKIAAIVRNGATDADPEAPRLTRLSEPEINTLLQGRVRLPDGVTEPRIGLAGEGRVTGHATVDLDIVRERNAGGWLDPTSYLTGRLPVSATSILHTANGTARVEIERVEVAGVPMPVLLLRELVVVYSRTPEYPDGIELDKPFRLPYQIREIRVSTGKAVIVQ